MDHLHQYKYRPTVYVLAIIDIILSSISLSWSFLFVITMCVAPEALANNIASAIPNRHNTNRISYNKDPDAESIEKPNVQSIVVFIWVAVCIQIMACVLQTVAAIKLLNASKPNANPMEALIQCRFWRRVTAFFTFLLFVKLIFGSEGRSMIIYLFTMSNIILRLTCIRYVHFYMKELRGAPPFGGILPIHHIITHTTVHPNHPSHPHHHAQHPAYYPAPPEFPKPSHHDQNSGMDLPPSYEECVKQPVNKEPDLRQ